MGNEDHIHMALPKLYGAPAYSRPPVTPARPVERPFDPDELPLSSELNEEERALVEQLVARPYDGAASSGARPASNAGPAMLRGRPFRLRSIGALFKGSDRDNGSGKRKADVTVHRPADASDAEPGTEDPRHG